MSEEELMEGFNRTCTCGHKESQHNAPGVSATECEVEGCKCKGFEPKEDE